MTGKDPGPLPQIPPGKRLKGGPADEFAAVVIARYKTDEKTSIRSIAEETGRSYGAIHDILAKAGVLRTPGRYLGGQGKS